MDDRFDAVITVIPHIKGDEEKVKTFKALRDIFDPQISISKGTSDFFLVWKVFGEAKAKEKGKVRERFRISDLIQLRTDDINCFLRMCDHMRLVNHKATGFNLPLIDSLDCIEAIRK